MRLRRKGLWLAACCAGILVPAAPAEAKGKIVSQWLDREIVVDGELDEWRDTLVYFNSVDAFVGAFNDESSLYLCLYSQSAEVSNQLTLNGLRVRIEGKQTDGFVIHFPRGAGHSERQAGKPRGDTDRIPAATDSIELELPGRRDRVAVSAGGEAGLEARVSHRGSFVYELRVPLVAGDGHPWAPGLFPGDKFKLLIEDPQIDVVDQAAAQDGHRAGASPFGQGMSGPYGSQSDPGWTGGVGAEGPFLHGGFAFVLKAQVELAKAP